MTERGMELLDRDRFARVVRDAPLVSIDLIVEAPDGTVLLGWRTNEPARDTWFVPGGSIRKDERLADAFLRVTAQELGSPWPLERAQFVGVYEHLYPTNFTGDPAFGTHYVVLAHRLRLEAKPQTLPAAQHARYRWFEVGALLADPGVHAHTRAYFEEV